MLDQLDAMKIKSILFDAKKAVYDARRDLEYGSQEYKDNKVEYYTIQLLRAKMDVIEAEANLKECKR